MSERFVDDDARDLIAGGTVDGRDGLADTLFVEAGAGSGKTYALVERVVALVLDGVPMPRIAAITFTEKAAAELTDRLRGRLTTAIDDADTTPDDRALLVAARDELDLAAVGTLHAFARRLLNEHAIDAGLPPNLEVLDDVASAIDFDERWHRDRLAMLDDPAMSRTLLLADAMGLPVAAGPGSTTMTPLVAAFNDNWDRLLDPATVPWPAEEPPSVADRVADLVRVADDVVVMMGTCLSPDDTLCRKIADQVVPWRQQLLDASDESEQFRLVMAKDPSLRFGNLGKKPSWQEVSKEDMHERLVDLRTLREELADEVVQGVLRRLAVEVRRLVLAAARDRQQRGRLEYHDLLVLARRMLRGEQGSSIRRSLRRRYHRLLLDEFQDTDPIQLELARLIATDPDADEEAAPDPGRLFFVGDPKQSIYRFRRADIGLYLDAAATYAGPDGPLELTTNFRSTPGVLTWVNAVFGRLIQPQERAQPAYVPLDPRPGVADAGIGASVTLLGVEPVPGELRATDQRRVEARQVADVVATALTDGWTVRDEDEEGEEHWRPCVASDIAILLPARTSLAMLEDELERRGIAYRADASSLVYATREIRDLLITVRAVADPADQLAVVSALRSTVFGCGDDDLATWRLAHGGRFDPTSPGGGPDAEDHPVGRALRHLGALHDALPFTTPAELLSSIIDDRRLFELGALHARPRDLWRRLRFVVDQARAWSETTAGTVREYVAWARMQASDSVRVAEAVLPETDDESVRILTIHAAKGLEFPITVLSGMTTKMQYRGAGIQVAWVDDGPIGLKVRKDVDTAEYRRFQPIDEQLDHQERLRLLYVAATRARDHLVVSLVRSERGPGGVPTSAEAFAGVCLDLDGLASVHTHRGVAAPVAAAPDEVGSFDPEAWSRERATLDRQANRQHVIAATAVQHQLPQQDDDVVAGDQKRGRDLDLPSSRKGRYGTAVGRAVHAVLQTVDLRDGTGIDVTAAAQAAAEGVVGREREIAGLARAALTAPAVQEAAAGTRWRETYVAATFGDRTVEGYLDLLYQRGEDLVVVDYKTANSLEDLDRRVSHYRAQGATYALTVERATGRSVADVVFVFLHGDRAVERRIPDLAAAVAEVRALLETVA